MTPDYLLPPLHCGLLPTGMTMLCGTVLCHWSEPGMGTPQAGIADTYFILQSYGLGFIWHYTAWLYVPVFRRRKSVPNLC